MHFAILGQTKSIETKFKLTSTQINWIQTMIWINDNFKYYNILLCVYLFCFFILFEKCFVAICMHFRIINTKWAFSTAITKVASFHLHSGAVFAFNTLPSWLIWCVCTWHTNNRFKRTKILSIESTNQFSIQIWNIIELNAPFFRINDDHIIIGLRWICAHRIHNNLKSTKILCNAFQIFIFGWSIKWIGAYEIWVMPYLVTLNRL